MAEYLLSDAQMRHFIVNGFVTVTTDLSAQFHDAVYEKTVSVFDKEGNPGNNLLPRIPEIQSVFDDPNVSGALTSLLGPDYYMQPHRHPHYNPPGSKGQGLHQDGGKRWSHHTRRLLVFYYPQDTPVELGPTGVVPMSHYFSTREGSEVSPEQPIVGEAGTVAFANYDLWHRAMPNSSEKRRYMMKFLYARMLEPEAPTWANKETDWANGTSVGPAEYQEMFRHLWNWHRGTEFGVANPSHNGTSNRASLSDLISSLNSTTESTGLQAAYELPRFGEKAVPALVRCLEEESEMTRRNACYALNAVGTPTVEALRDALKDPREYVRDNAAEALGDLGNKAEPVVSALVETLADESGRVRSRIAEALGTTSQSSSIAVPGLVKALADKNDGVRRNAVFALARIGENATDAVEGLQSVLFDANRYIRGDAVHALYRIGTLGAKSVLLRHLQTTRWCPITSSESTF
ncbi:MAG: HEAT repeat domain-containing protein [Candidatus Poribacteria bacterium]|nr:HEAT repeat domain-containing protein [Candidatus Poribacteria bacterium]